MEKGKNNFFFHGKGWKSSKKFKKKCLFRPEFKWATVNITTESNVLEILYAPFIILLIYIVPPFHHEKIKNHIGLIIIWFMLSDNRFQSFF